MKSQIGLAIWKGLGCRFALVFVRLNVLVLFQVFLFSQVIASQNQFSENMLVASYSQSIRFQDISSAVIESQAPSFVKQTTARLNGRIALDQSYDAVEYYFEYGRTIDYSDQTDVNLRPGGNTRSSHVFADIFNLTCASNYHFRLVTTLRTNIDDGTGKVIEKVDTAFGSDAIFQTAECSAVEIYFVDVIEKTKDSVILSGSFNDYGRENTFFFKYGETKDMSLVSDQVTQTGVSFRETLKNLKCGTLYFYQLYVSDGVVIVQDDVSTFKTISCPASPLVIDLSPMDITENSAILRVDVSANGVITEVVFEYGETESLALISYAITVSESAVEQTIEIPITSLTCQTTYFYQASVSNEKGSVKGERKTFTTSVCGSAKPLADYFPNKVFAGANHSLVVGDSGELVTWGDNVYSQLGRKTEVIQVVDVLRDNAAADHAVLFGFTSAALGARHTLILHESGWVSAFGDNQLGQSGVSDSSFASMILVPTTLRDETQQFVISAISIAAGAQHSLAVTANNQVLVWGDNTYGQLGREANEPIVVPTKIDNISDAEEVFAGDNFSIVKLVDNTLLSWGRNTEGQLGQGNNQIFFEPDKINSLSDIVIVAAGASHVLALDSTGQLFAWGDNTSAQLGLGDTENKNLPTLNADTLLIDVVQLAAGASHSLALLRDGTVLGWGSNDKKQLGGDERSVITSPANFLDDTGASIQNIVSIAAGANFSTALTSDGRVLSWGDNSQGQLSGRPMVQANSATLTSIDNTQVNMKQVRLFVNDNNVVIKNGEVLHLSVWLTEKPAQTIIIRPRLSDESGLVIQNGVELLFSVDDWFKKRTVTLKAENQDASGAQDAELLMEAAELATVKVEVRIVDGERVSKQQVVGALQIKYLLFMLILLSWTKLQITQKKLKKLRKLKKLNQNII